MRLLLKTGIIILIYTAFVSQGIVTAQSGTEVLPTHKLSGLVYSDYYYMISNHNEALEGENGFWVRRVYFTYDNKLSQSVSGRLRLEMASPGDFSTNAKMEPVVKDLYINWAMNENHSLIAGLSSSPTFGLAEKIWGYRSVEKSPLDSHNAGRSNV